MTYSVNLLKLMGIEFAKTILEDKEIPSEQRLWRGVLCNALEDTMQGLSDRKTSIFKMEAHEWIINSEEDFQKVCYWSGFDPDLVKANETAYLANFILLDIFPTGASKLSIAQLGSRFGSAIL